MCRNSSPFVCNFGEQTGSIGLSRKKPPGLVKSPGGTTGKVSPMTPTLPATTRVEITGNIIVHHPVRPRPQQQGGGK